jgi:hypothetical protein
MARLYPAEWLVNIRLMAWVGCPNPGPIPECSQIYLEESRGVSLATESDIVPITEP